MSDHPPQTYLFVPGNRPERFAKALASGADRVILDLEVAMAPDDKAAVRDAIAQWMAGAGEAQGKIMFCINDDATPWHLDDLALMRAVQPACVMLPKCEIATQVAAVLASLAVNATVLPLIETARGVMGLPGIAAAPGVARLAFGALDYMADLDIPSDSLALDIAAIADRRSLLRGRPGVAAGGRHARAEYRAGQRRHAACAQPGL